MIAGGAGQAPVTCPPADPLDVLAGLLKALRANRGGPQALDAARRLLDALREAQQVCADTDQRWGWVFLAELVEDQEALVSVLETKEAERETERQRAESEALASVAADMDGPAVTLDGGPSNYGASDFLADVETWAKGRAR